VPTEVSVGNRGLHVCAVYVACNWNWKSTWTTIANDSCERWIGPSTGSIRGHGMKEDEYEVMSELISALVESVDSSSPPALRSTPTGAYSETRSHRDVLGAPSLRSQLHGEENLSWSSAVHAELESAELAGLLRRSGVGYRERRCGERLQEAIDGLANDQRSHASSAEFGHNLVPPALRGPR